MLEGTKEGGQDGPRGSNPYRTPLKSNPATKETLIKQLEHYMGIRSIPGAQRTYKNVETVKVGAMSTLLDPRFKARFFMTPENRQAAIESLIEEVLQLLEADSAADLLEPLDVAAGNYPVCSAHL